MRVADVLRRLTERQCQCERCTKLRSGLGETAVSTPPLVGLPSVQATMVPRRVRF
jgi:hypothetical protein